MSDESVARVSTHHERERLLRMHRVGDQAAIGQKQQQDYSACRAGGQEKPTPAGDGHQYRAQQTDFFSDAAHNQMFPRERPMTC
jgi:hypothetical protein